MPPEPPEEQTGTRPKLYYTFGNHMHWVDMEWLWGYGVLPGSIRDMLHLCREAGVKGCVNFDGVGYEKLASEAPEALAELRAAVAEGMVEPVGCSYGQPYGLFHGGESNVRHLVYGARAVRRLLGVWPRTFWEEEFYCFPQLPQMLAAAGFTGASLFFQWTWHTPEIPRSDAPVALWTGLDGTQLPAATRNKLNVHQWPEDMDAVLAELEGSARGGELVQQWLELMPSQDWMCRSEVILPKLRELLADPRFEVVPVTLGEFLAAGAAEGTVPALSLGVDSVWHGFTLGKNGDEMRRRSREAERALLEAEALQAIAGLLGRPYAQWDAYPVWELEEGWRELLAAQHHDNDECEGLCGRVGKRQYERAEGIARDVRDRAARRLALAGSETIRDTNLFGWRAQGPDGRRTVPPYSIVEARETWNPSGLSLGFAEGDRIVTQGPGDRFLSATFDLASATITRLSRPGGPELASRPIGRFFLGEKPAAMPFLDATDIDGQFVWAGYGNGDDHDILEIHRASPHHGLEIGFDGALDLLLDQVTPGFKGALTMDVPLPWPDARIYADTPFGVVEVGPGAKGVRKYPEGDWMTSPQWFEDVEGAFTSLTFVDIVDPATGEGLFVGHRGHQQWFRREGAVRCVLAAEDPWDEGYFHRSRETPYSGGDSWQLRGGLEFVPHGPIDHAERWKMGQEYGAKPSFDEGAALMVFGDIQPGNVVITALYRESEEFAGQHLEGYAGAGMGLPYVLRLLELNGEAAVATLTVPGPVARAFKTDLLGRIVTEVEVGPSRFRGTPGLEYAELSVPMRPHEIATLFLDIVPGRKQTRDLDAKREIWATVHRIEQP